MICKPFTTTVAGSSMISQLFCRLPDISGKPLLTIIFSGDACNVTLKCGSGVIGPFTCALIAGKGVIDTPRLYLSLNVPEIPVDIFDAEVNPALVQYSYAPEGNKIEISTGKGLTWSRYGNKITLSLDPAIAEDDTIRGADSILAINGIRPDDNGNIDILSVSPELQILVKAGDDKL